MYEYMIMASSAGHRFESISAYLKCNRQLMDFTTQDLGCDLKLTDLAHEARRGFRKPSSIQVMTSRLPRHRIPSLIQELC